MVIAVVAAVVVLVLLVGLAVVYNRLVRDRNRVRHTWADIDALLVRRAAAIPRLAAIVDAAFDHERETLQEVAQARAAVEAAGGPRTSGRCGCRPCGRALPGALVAGPLGFRHEPYLQPSEPIVG